MSEIPRSALMPSKTLCGGGGHTAAENPQFGAGRIAPADWLAGTQHMITMLRAYLINCGTGCNSNIKIEWDGPYDALQAQYYPGDAYVDIIGTDDYVRATSATNAYSQWSFYATATGGYLNRGFLLTFAQQHNKPSVWPEWCDYSAPPNEIDGTIITQYNNLFASVQGPGNTGILAQGYWYSTNNLPECDLGTYPAKKAAYSAAYPNGYGGWHYSGTYWLQKAAGALIPIPAPNPWGAP